MTRATVMKLIFQFFLPILIGNLFQQLYSFVDSMVVGKGIGDVALAAVGNTSSVHFLILLPTGTYRRTWDLYFPLLWSE